MVLFVFHLQLQRSSKNHERLNINQILRSYSNLNNIITVEMQQVYSTTNLFLPNPFNLFITTSLLNYVRKSVWRLGTVIFMHSHKPNRYNQN